MENISHAVARHEEEIRALKASHENALRALRSGGTGGGIGGGSLTVPIHSHAGGGQGGLVDSGVIIYVPSVLTDWDGDGDPGDVDDALDQLAERIDDVEGAAGHSETHDLDDTAVHTTAQDFTSLLKLLGIEIATGDLGMFSDAGITRVGTWDGATGHISIGPTAPGTLIPITVEKTFADPSGAVRGMFFNPTVSLTGANANEIQGVYARPRFASTQLQSGIVSAFQADISRLANSPTITDYRQFWANLSNSGLASLTLTNRYGLYVTDATINGTITNQYGVYIENLAKGGTLNIPILSLGGASRHVGAWKYGVNAAPAASALADWESTTQGLLPPRMTTTQRDAIGSPATALLIFNTTTGLYEFYTGAAWTPISDLAAHLADTTDAHDASAISVADAGGYFTATEVEAALQEIMADGQEVTITIETPTASENLVVRQFTQAVTIVAIQAVVIGGTSVTIDPEHGSAITTATKLLSAPESVASASTGGEHIGGTGTAMAATFNDATLAAGDFLRLETTAISGVPTQLSVTFRYRLL